MSKASNSLESKVALIEVAHCGISVPDKEVSSLSQESQSAYGGVGITSHRNNINRLMVPTNPDDSPRVALNMRKSIVDQQKRQFKELMLEENGLVIPYSDTMLTKAPLD